MTTQYWITGTAGDWSQAGDWQSGVVPGATDDAVISTSYAVTVIGTAAANSLTLDNSFLTLNGTLTLGTSLTLDSGELLLVGGTLSAQSIVSNSISDLWGYGTISGAVSGTFGIIADGGTLKVQGLLAGDQGSFNIDSGATLELSNGTTQSVYFQGSSATLKLDAPTAFTGPINGFAVGDTIDLAGITAASATYDGSTLTINETNGQHLTYNISGGAVGNALTVASDNNGGSIVYWARPPDSWITGAAGDWSTGADWLSGVVPGSTDNAVIVSSTAVTVNGIAVANLLVLNYESELTVSGTLTIGTSLTLNDGSTLHLTGGTLSAQSIRSDSGTLGEIAGYGTVSGAVNGKIFTVAQGGTLKIEGSLSGDQDALYIDKGATLELSNGTADAVYFDGNPDAATLKLDAPTAFTGPINGFAVGDTIDLAGITAASARYDGSTLTINETNGQHLTYHVSGGGVGNTLTVASDNNGGTIVYWVEAPGVTSVAATTDTGASDLNAGHVVTVSVATSEVVYVTGSPTLQLNDNEVAIYQSGTGTNVLTFSYTVTEGDTSSDLQVTGLNLANGAAIQDGAGHTLTGSIAQDLALQIDTTAPTIFPVAAVTDNHATDVNAGHLVTITMTTSESVTVTGTPTLQLNDNEVATYTKGSGTNTLTFTYTVQSGDNVADLRVTGLNLPSGATIQDAAGNNLSGSVTSDLGIQIDTTAPSAPVINTTAPAQDNAASINIVGTAEALSTVTLSNGASVVGTTAADGSGNWQVNGIALTDGADYSFTATATDAAINTSGASNKLAFHDDQTAPAVTESLVSDTGSSSSDRITSNPALTGSGDPNAVVHFTVDGNPITAAATANSSGIWTFTPTGLSNSSHTIMASETDAAGNTGTASLTFTLDTTAPVPVITSEVLNKSGAVALTGTTGEANDTIAVYDGTTLLGTTTTASNGTWNFTTGKVSNVVHTYRGAATDVAGNIGPSSNEAILGSTNADTLVGTSGNDIIIGNGGNDTITGGLGADTLTGGSGKVRFVYKSSSDSIPSSHDAITDFNASRDIIDFTNIAGINAHGGVATFEGKLTGSGNLTLNAHSVAYIEVNGNTEVLVNTTNTAETVTSASVSAANMEIVLVGIHLGLKSADFHHV